MPLSFPIGRVLGIPVRVHLSWFVVLVLATASFAGQFVTGRGALHPYVALVPGFFTAMLLFASVLLHELGHCVLAQHFGIHVRQIQLFIFGGVAEILGEPRRVMDEVLIAAAGPAVSFLLAFGFGVLAVLLGGVPFSEDGGGVLGRMALAIAVTNFVLAVFNLIPAFPTDGGRILRAMLWGLFGDYRRATSWAAALGTAFASALILIGTWNLMSASGTAPDAMSDRLGGMWFVFVGIFLARSASQAKRHAGISAALREGFVHDVMTRNRASVPAERTLLEVFTATGGPSAADMVLGFPVTEGGRWAGFVEPARIPPKEEWGRLTAGELMTPFSALPAVQLHDPLDQLVRVMTERNANGAVVLHEDQVVGYVDRSDVLRWLIATQQLPT